jgi:pimeloyl-ACP methyl ester carboxylesterase
MRKIFGGSWHTGRQMIFLQSSGRIGRLLDHEGKAPRSAGLRPIMKDLLLLSGLLSDDTPWIDVAARLAAVCRVRIISFADCSSLGAMAERALANAPERFALAGHSMGGRVALEVWRRAPERIAALGLLNTGAAPRRPEEAGGRARLLKIAQEQGMAALAAEWLPPMMAGPPATAEQRSVLERLTGMVEGQTAASFAAQIQALLDRPDAEPLLTTIDVPTLLLSGREDTWSPVSQHLRMQRMIPGSIFVEVANAGHMAPIEQPEAAANALREHLIAAMDGDP